MLSKAPTKSCALDPAPTWLLKRFAAEIASAQTQLINMSLETGMVPKNFKQALVRPLLKRNNLNADDLKNCRPVSNLSFVSKQLERVVATRLSEHLYENNLCEALQSAYKSNHSTEFETAVLRVSNDILRAMDDGRVDILVLLDLSAAFDTVDHSLLIQRPQNEAGLTGTPYRGSGPISRKDVSASSSRARYLQNSSCALACHKDQS